MGGCLFALVILGSLVESVLSANTKEVAYETTVPQENCVDREERSCTRVFIFFSRCSSRTVRSCSTQLVTVTKTKVICKDGWDGMPDCLIPICTRCNPGQVCTAPERCDCLTTGGSCTNVACDSSRSCYPGTCYSGNCKCPLNFEGNDCEIILKTPDIRSCQVSIMKSSIEIATVSCEAEYLQPTPTWINSDGLTKLTLSSQSIFQTNLYLPDISAAPYVSIPVNIGITNVGFGFSVDGKPELTKSCGEKSPTTFAECVQQFSLGDLGLTLSHKTELQISSYASLGGTKQGSNRDNLPYSNFPIKPFSGNSAKRLIKLKMDNKSPTHCLQDPNADCPIFPIYIENDITTESLIQSRFVGWNDTDSGIQRYHVEVYLLRSNSKYMLANVGPPFITKDLQSAQNAFAFACTTSGVYSIELTVFDWANNTAKARNIFVYNSNAELKTDETKPLNIMGAKRTDANKNKWWLTDINEISKKYIVMSWRDRYSSDARFSDEWSLAVEPWTIDGIDDIPSSKNYYYGARTIKQFDNLGKGIAYYTLSYYVDETGGGRVPNFQTFEPYNSSKNDVNVNFTSLTDGSTLVIQLACFDFAGGKIEEVVYVQVDTSPPRVYNSTFYSNQPDIYSSSIGAWIEEKNSGIKSINYSLYDETLKAEIRSGSIDPGMRDAPQTNNGISKRADMNQPCTANDQTCYCTPLSQCYNYIQNIEIDHCWIDRLTDHRLSMKIVVINNAGLASSQHIAQIGDIKELSCRPSNSLSPGQTAAIVICVLILILVLAAILALLIRIYIVKKPPPHFMTTAYGNVRNKISSNGRSQPVKTENSIYASEPPQFFHQSNYNETGSGRDENPYTRLSMENIILEEEISRGGMLVINKATYKEPTGEQIVAVKQLKGGSSDQEKQVFKRRVEYLSSLTIHENIVKIIGVVMSPTQGMMMVLEYCEFNLKTWLSSISVTTPEVIDDMTSIALGVARGVQHLHSQQTIHKRLRAGNVLLTKNFSQYVPKLIGFGPDEDSDSSKSSVPIKWLAPETLKSLNSRQTFYSEKTDTWSFGILLWEIYTKAKSQPYLELDSSKAKKAIISGETMDRPEDCPPAIHQTIMSLCWNNSPAKRPNFTEIINEFEDFRSNDRDKTGYYVPEKLS